MGEHAEQLERIRRKLFAVRAARPETFGGGSHRYELGPPLSEAAMRAFEVERGITLPSGFRAFLREVGHGGPGPHGGAGPYYGLFALDTWAEYLDWIGVDAPGECLLQPSPLRPGPNELPEWDDDVADEEWPPPALREMYQGILTIGTRGCSYMTGLVVTGEYRGRVVYLDADQSGGPYVGRDADFLDWYERWLDELLAGVRHSWFGYGPAGGPRELLGILAGADDEELRVEALGNLRQCPSLGLEVWRALTQCLGAASARVRASAVEVFAAAPSSEAATIAPLLTDVDEDVRRAACRVLVKLYPERHADDAWRLLREDPSERVRTDAFFALQPRGLLSQEQLVEIVTDPRLSSLRYSAAYHVKWGQEHAELLAALCDDENEDVARIARNALADRAT